MDDDNTKHATTETELTETELIKIKIKNDKKLKHKEALQKYYLKHKDEKYICDICLGKVSFSNVYHHKKSAKHMAWLDKINKDKLNAEAMLKDKNKDKDKLNTNDIDIEL